MLSMCNTSPSRQAPCEDMAEILGQDLVVVQLSRKGSDLVQEAANVDVELLVQLLHQSKVGVVAVHLVVGHIALVEGLSR